MSAAAAAVQLDTGIKRAVYIREQLNSDTRNFVFSKAAQESYTKEFNHVKHDIRLMNFAQDIIGAISDCYILYAVAMMGICDIESVQMFLGALSRKHKDLAISDVRDFDSMKKRFRSLTKNGFLFKHRYEYHAEGEDGRSITRKINMYTIEKSGQYLVAQKLGTQIAVNEWIDAKPLSELMGWAACGYVKGRIVSCGKFLEYKQGIFRTKAIGTIMYPGEVTMQGTEGERITVGFIQAFMRHNKAIHTKGQFDDACLRTVNTIKQYFYLRDMQNKNACIVVVVEDNPDLMTAADYIHKSGILLPDYGRIFFTGEGIIRQTSDEGVGECFLQMRALGDGGFDFVSVIPDFIAV